MCPNCNKTFGITRIQCTWCRKFVCDKCDIEVPADRFNDGRSHSACRACFEERMTGQDKAESAFDELSKPDEIWSMSDGKFINKAMNELGRVVSGTFDEMVTQVFRT